MNPRNLEMSNRHRHEFQMMRKVGWWWWKGVEAFCGIGYCVARMAEGTVLGLLAKNYMMEVRHAHMANRSHTDCAGLKSVQFIYLICYFICRGRIYLLRRSCMICTDIYARRF